MELYITNDDQHLMSLYSDKMEEHNTKVLLASSSTKRRLGPRRWPDGQMRRGGKLQYIYDKPEFDYADSGFDLFIPKNDMEEDGSWVIGPFETRCISLKVKLRMTIIHFENDKKQNENINSNCVPSLPYCIYSRSSISKTPLMLANGVGIMDAGYRGECKVALKNISNSEYVIQPYTRLVQACRPDLAPFGVRIVNEEFDTTARGSGGFGSTGL